MNKLEKIAAAFNVLASFCAVRDIAELSQAALLAKYNYKQADVMIVFGGTIAGGFDAAAQGYKNNVAKRLMLVGGYGHTTEALRQIVHTSYPQIVTAGRMEAEIMADYFKYKYGIEDVLLEIASTNCGNNVTNALKILAERNIPADKLLIIQDGTMQRRMAAGFAKFAPTKQIISYASYQAELAAVDGQLQYKTEPLWGMWNIERYITLLMGEIPRMRDDANGYGPKGQNYIAHVDLPAEVSEAFELLQANYGSMVRIANAAYRSK